MIAERAELVARLSLKDDMSKGLAGAKRSVGGLNSSLKDTRRIAGGVALGSMIDRAVSAGIRGFVGAIKAGNASLAELEAVGLRTNAVIKSTKGVAGQSAESIRNLAEKYEELSTFDDKAIQNTENLLLTFTNIRTKGFEPTLEAVLNMNAAMGGGDEGLQDAAIRVGKAMQDPIQGITALKRVGVNFTNEQKKLIASLVEEGDLFEAQKIILGELETEFGGQAGAFGKGKAADVRRLNDAVEDFQITLSEGLAPAVDAGRRGLTKLLKDPEVLQGIKDLGAGISDLFTPEGIQGGIDGVKGVIRGLRDVPWDVIGNSMMIAGGGAKLLFDSFTKMPSWVQTAVVTGWGLNKLTGGLVGELGKGLIKGVLGINAGVVNVRGAVVNGGGVPGGGAVPVGAGKTGMSAVSKLFLIGEAIGLVAAVANVASEVQKAGVGQAQGIGTVLEQSLAGPQTAGELKMKLDAIDTGIARLKADPVAAALITGPVIAELEQQRRQVVAAINRSQRTGEDLRGGIDWGKLTTPRREPTRTLRRYGKSEDKRGDVDWSKFEKPINRLERKNDRIVRGVERLRGAIDWGKLTTPIKSLENKTDRVKQSSDRIITGVERLRDIALRPPMSAGERAALAKIERKNDRIVTGVERTKAAVNWSKIAIKGAVDRVAPAGHSDTDRIVAAIHGIDLQARVTVNGYTYGANPGQPTNQTRNRRPRRPRPRQAPPNSGGMGGH